MQIVIVESNSSIFDQVIELANHNSKTLGFLPMGAFEQKAHEKKIIAATDGNDLYGYVLFEYNISKSLVYIVHLCVEKKRRKNGVARSLLRELESTVKDIVGGIRVRCRIDYDANRVWPKLGFKHIQTVEGRSKRGSELAVWRKDLPFHDLFRPLIERKKPMVRACLDLNILSNSLKSRSPSTSGAHSIMEDWLSEIIEFYISPELAIELKREKDQSRKAKIKQLARSNNEITISQREYQQARERIRGLFGATERDQSDLNHLAWCSASKMDYFVTSDEPLLNKNRQIYENSGVKIIHPCDLILYTDTLLRAAEYQPQRFGESEIHIRRFTNNDYNMIETTIAQEAPEGPRSFKSKLRHFLSSPVNVFSQLIMHNQILLGLISWEIIPNNKLQVHLLRLTSSNHNETLSVGVISWLLRECITHRTQCLEISDKRVPGLVTEACLKLGFRQYGGLLTRWTKQGHFDVREIRSQLNACELAKTLSPKYCKHLRSSLDRIIGSQDISLLLHIEKDLWPIKIKQLLLPSYVVCIRPEYARHLFDYEISLDDLFGGDFRLLLNIENSYYKSMSGPKISPPARILWYVSKGRSHYVNCQAIRAVSYLDEMHEGNPKELFNRLQHLGVYKWPDVLKIVDGDQTKSLMAFVFSRTEIFRNPVSLISLNQIWQKERGNNFHIQAPLVISDNIFWKVYNLGMGLPDEKNNKG